MRRGGAGDVSDWGPVGVFVVVVAVIVSVFVLMVHRDTRVLVLV